MSLFGLRLVSEALPSITSKVFSRKYIMLGRLVTHWKDIIGEDLASKTQPVKLRYFKSKIKGGKASASLDIAATPSDAAVLHYQKDLILERINHIFGDRWINSIRFIPKVADQQNNRRGSSRKKPLDPLARKQLEDIIAHVDDPDIKERLKSLGTYILQK